MEEQATCMKTICPYGESIHRTEEKVDRVVSMLTGNGSPESGFVIRMDRVERKIDMLDIKRIEDIATTVKFINRGINIMGAVIAGALITITILMIKHLING